MRAREYTETFKPYRSRYVVAEQSLPSGELFEIPEKATRRGYLSLARIERAMDGGEYVATFAGTHAPDIFGLDIDDHDRPPGYLITAVLLDAYGAVVAAIGTRPSLLFQTPRGLHAYWILTERIPYAALRTLVTERISHVAAVEFRPTPTEAIRIPQESRAIRPDTLAPVGLRFGELVTRAERYAPVELFDESATPAGFRRRPGARSRSAPDDMYRVESETLPLVNGATYEPVTRLLVAYRAAGLTERAAAWRFRDVVLPQSIGYAGDLHNPRIIAARIRYFWRNRQPVVIRPRAMQATLADSLVAGELVKLSPFAPQRNRPIERFVLALLATDRYHRGLVVEHTSLTDLALWRWQYPHYERSVRRGFVPLPHAYLYKLNGRYRELVAWLVELGFLEPLDVTGRAPGGSYRAGNLGDEQAYCRHYQLHPERFGAEGF